VLGDRRLAGETKRKETEIRSWVINLRKGERSNLGKTALLHIEVPVHLGREKMDLIMSSDNRELNQSRHRLNFGRRLGLGTGGILGRRKRDQSNLEEKEEN